MGHGTTPQHAHARVSTEGPMHGFELEPIPLDPGPKRLISELAMNAIRDGVIICSSDGQIAAVNRTFCEMTGFSPAELVGARQPLPYWPPELVARIRADIVTVLEEGSGEYDLYFQRKDGERFPAIASVGVSPQDHSRIIVVKDVTERVALAAQLTAAKQEADTARVAFARSAEVIGECLYSTELLPDDRFVTMALGPGLAALIGAEHEPGGDLDVAIAPCVHPDDRASFDREWRYDLLVMADGQIIEQRYRLIGHDGVTRWVRDRARITVVGKRVFLSGATCDISAQQLAEDQRADDLGRLEWLSSVDSLTGLFNRRHFSELLHLRTTDSAAGTAIALIDVDSFKRINDAYGHSTGDVVLREVANRLKSSTRASDLIARWGGEEFCVLLGRVENAVDLEARAERLRIAVTSTSIVLPDIPPIAVTVSVGVARAGSGLSTDDLFASADSALYEAKRAGRNRTRIASGDRRSTQRARLRR
jgi:diguanylate cyclase (GGDEF)-like protein/PAS domain S-box-containing protein